MLVETYKVEWGIIGFMDTTIWISWKIKITAHIQEWHLGNVYEML